MRIRSVTIENFRSIRNLTCELDEVTSFIGPNGVGKSNIIRALDWFFNGTSLAPEDRFKGAALDDPVRVQVNFDALTAADRQALGAKYCPDDDSSTFTAWRTWRSGDDKMTARAKAKPEFERVRFEDKAAGKKAVYSEMRAEFGLPAWSNAETAESLMRRWELEHPEELEDAEVSDSHFFGFNGRGLLSGLFDFVFVSADLRAPDETADRKDSLLDRILRRAVQREEFDGMVAAAAGVFQQAYDDAGKAALGAQLDALSTEFTKEIASYSPGREVRLVQAPPSVKLPPSVVSLQILDRGVETPIQYQGHGFQRTLLLAGLTLLSRQGRRVQQDCSMFLAIEEPELFQHPTQARAFASVLRSLAQDATQRTQVAFATHNPHFVTPEYFDQVRRVCANVGATGVPETSLTVAALSDVQQKLQGFLEADSVSRRFEQVCLKHLPEALFAERVILVEGDDDAAIVEGVGMRVNALAVNGICVAPVSGKAGMLIPFAVLELLGIPTLMVVDNDSGCETRMTRNGRTGIEIRAAINDHKRTNRALCRLVAEPEQDYAVGPVGTKLYFIPDTLETLLNADFPGWEETRTRVVSEGRGVEGKHAGTYALAVRECEDEMGKGLLELASAVVPMAA